MRRILLLIFSLVGATFLITSAVMLGVFHQQTASMVPVEGAIADWQGDTPVIAYELNGETYETQMSVSSSIHWAVGSPYRLMADPENPTHAMDYFLVLMGGIFGAMALLLLTVGFTVWIVMGRGARRREELLQYGLRTTAVITELKLNRSVQVNHRNPWNIIASCTHPSTREEMTVRSHMVWKPAVAVGDTVDVAFDPMDERRYAMDIPEESR